MIKPRTNISLTALSLIILVSGGCSSLKPTIVDEIKTSAPPARPSISQPPSQGQPEVSAPSTKPTVGQSPSPEQPKASERSTKPVATLLAKAETEFHTGQLDRSAALLERAIRISPKDPHLWQRLAQVRLQQRNAEQAETLAAKSNSLSNGLDSALLRTNWEIIAEARRQQADEAGVRQAEDQLRRLSMER
jgi:tetratricopeptide (TPR) repeat protein